MSGDQEEVITTDRVQIKRWAKERGGVPAFFFKSYEQAVEPDLRINFANAEMDERSQEVTWDHFFEELEDRRLAVKFRTLNPDGRASNYCTFVTR
jgi:hypothetical protein